MHDLESSSLEIFEGLVIRVLLACTLGFFVDYIRFPILMCRLPYTKRYLNM